MAHKLNFTVSVSCEVTLEDSHLKTIADALDIDASELNDNEIVDFLVSEANYELAFDSDHVESFGTEITHAEKV